MQIITELLELKGLRIYKIQNNEHKILIRVGSTKKKVVCNNCSCIFAKTGNKHENGLLSEYQHGILNNKEIILQAKRNRFKCPKCTKIITEELGGLKLSNGYARTSVFDKLVLERLSTDPTLTSIARSFNISVSKVKNILISNTSKGPWISNAIEKLRSGFVMGVDEKHFLKKQFHLVITSISGRKLLALGKDRSKTTLIKFFKEIKQKAIPKAICIDMWRPYLNAIYEVFGKEMPVVIDKFHVYKLVNTYLLQSKDIIEHNRKSKNPLNYSLPSFRALLYSNKNLNRSPSAKRKLATLLKYDPKLIQLRRIRNLLEEFYSSKSRKEGEKRLRELVAYAKSSYCPYGADLARTFERWFKEITNYFDYPYTNAYTEGINNKLENTNRDGYGFRNRDIYLRRVSLLVR